MIWFKECVPRCSFITWLTLRVKLPTKDRLQRWGLKMAMECVFCPSDIESHDHLFFECDFSTDIWCHFVSTIDSNPHLDLQSAASWIIQGRHQPHFPASIITKFILQTTIYLVEKSEILEYSHLLPRRFPHLKMSSTAWSETVSYLSRSILLFSFSPWILLQLY